MACAQFLRNGPPLLSPVVSRTDMCAHLTLVSGHCPTSTGEVMVSDRIGRARSLRVGSTYTIAPETGYPTEPALKTAAYPAHVVGWYRPPPTTATDTVRPRPLLARCDNRPGLVADRRTDRERRHVYRHGDYRRRHSARRSTQPLPAA